MLFYINVIYYSGVLPVYIVLIYEVIKILSSGKREVLNADRIWIITSCSHVITLWAIVCI